MDDQGTGSAGGPARPPISWQPPDLPTGSAGGPARPPISWQPPDLPTGSAGGPSGAPVNWPPPDLPTGRDVPEAPPNAAQRILAAFAWIVGIFCVLFLGRVFPILGGSRTLTAYEVGQVIGTIVVAVLVGVFVRWVVVKLRRRGRVLSPWILVVANLLLLLSVGRQPGVGASITPGLPIDSYLTIGTPYSLTAPTADEAEQFKAAFAGRLGNYEVRRVLEAGDHLGFLIVANLGAESSADFRRGLVLGFEDNEGAEAHESVVGTRSAVVGSGPTGSAVIWVESPYVLSIYAIDEESARLLAESVMASYETES